MMRPGKLALLLAIAGLSACGSQKALSPRPGMATAPVANGADRPATADEMMKASSQARPDRSAEPLKRSTEREQDPFDLPPS